jgi:hypothetical protein
MSSISYTTAVNVQNTEHFGNRIWFALAEIFGWSDVRMALRYTHATDEAKGRAVEKLVKPIGPSDESVTNEKGRVCALP